jgi:hypothetical protein
LDYLKTTRTIVQSGFGKKAESVNLLGFYHTNRLETLGTKNSPMCRSELAGKNHTERGKR